MLVTQIRKLLKDLSNLKLKEEKIKYVNSDIKKETYLVNNTEGAELYMIN